MQAGVLAMSVHVLSVLLAVILVIGGCMAPGVPSPVSTPTLTSEEDVGINLSENLFEVKGLCTSGFERSREEVEAELMEEAKRRALEKLYGEEIKVVTVVEGGEVARDRVESAAAGKIRTLKAPLYTAGTTPGDICIEVVFYTTEEDRQRFRAQPIQGKACADQLPRERVQAEVRRAAELDALHRYDARLRDIPDEVARTLLRNVNYVQDGYIGATTTYCVEVRAEIIPILAETFLAEKEVEQATPANERAEAPTPSPPLSTRQPIDLPTDGPREPTPVQGNAPTRSPDPGETPMPPVALKGELLYEDTFDDLSQSASAWIIEEGMNISNGTLVIYPGFDAVLRERTPFTDFVFEARLFIPTKGSNALYLRYQRPPCATNNCSIQIALYYDSERSYQEVVARRFIGDKPGQQIDLIKNPSVSALYLGRWNTIVVSVRGDDYQVYLNDEHVLSFTDDTYDSGLLSLDNAGPHEIAFDYIRIYAPGKR